MSFGTASVDVELDAKRAVAELQNLLKTIASTDAIVTLSVNATNVAPAIDRALDQADNEISVTADARQVTGSVDSSIDAADSEVLVTGDASQVTGEVTGAVDAADSDVIVTGDAANVTGSINGAVSAADSEVIIVGDAKEVTGAINGAVAAADTSIAITVSDSGLSQANSATGQLDTSLAAAAGSAGKLKGALAAAGFAAAAAGAFSLVNAASEAEQSVGAAAAIFGSASGTIETFANTSAEAAGLTATSARTMTAQIGALLQGFGFTQDEAAQTSVVLAQLGADLAATFGGTPEDAVLALGAALRGEFDPLERFGVSLNVAQSNLRAVELGLADSTSNVDANAKAQGALSLIMERSAGAQGQFARELSTTAGQLAVAKASAQEAAVVVGETLAPTFIELLGIVTDQVLPALQEMGTSLGPALASAVGAGVPVLAGAIDVLVALTPVITALAAVIESIPAPVLQVVGTFLALRGAAGPLGSVFPTIIRSLGGLSVAAGLNVSSMGLLRGGLATAKDGVAQLASSISPLTVILGTAALAFSFYSTMQSRARKEAQELENQADSLREALGSQEGTIDGLVELFDRLISSGDELQTTLLNLEADADETFRTAGISAQDFAEALADPSEPLVDLVARLREASDTMESFDVDAKELAAQTLTDLAAQTSVAADEMIEAGVATDRWSEAQANAARESTKAADGSFLYVAALDQLVEQEKAAEEAAQAQADALTEQEKALQALVEKAPQVTFLLQALGTETTRNADLLGAFAVAATEAGLSEEEMTIALAQLGATSPQAAADLQAVADTINGVKDAGLNTLPSLQDIAGEINDFSLTGFRDNLEEALDAIRNFNSNLVTIAQEGGPRLAAAASELGPQFAAEIAEGIRNGEPGVAQQVELLLAAVEGAGTDTDALLSGTIGPNLAVATGQMGALATSAFGTNFRLDASGKIVELDSQIAGGGPGVRFRTEELGKQGTAGFDSGLDLTTPAAGAISDLDNAVVNSIPGVRTRSQEMGTSATSGFDTGFTPVTPARKRTNEARTAIQSSKDSMRNAGSSTGQAGTSGFSSGVAGFGTAGRTAVVQAINTILRLRSLARSGGQQVGAAMGQGMISGIASQTANVAAAAANAVESAIRAAKIAAKTGSPSKVFMEIGGDMGQGMAIGIDDEAASVAASSSSLVVAAANAAASETMGAQNTRLISTALDVAGGSSTPAGVNNTNVTFGFGSVQVELNFTGAEVPNPTERQAIGDDIGTAIADTLERRSLRVAARTA